MTNDYGFYIKQAAKDRPVSPEEAGQSGYFSTPATTLDPHLFEGRLLKPDVRAELTRPLTQFWRKKKYIDPNMWSKLFLAGSAASYQWAEKRGNGDIDILLGFDYLRFLYHNRRFAGMDENDVADYINNELRLELWPETSSVDFGGQVYEITYYLNPGTGMDISSINPYAAYNISDNTWAVDPIVLPSDPRTLYPNEWFSNTEDEHGRAQELGRRFNTVMNDLAASAPGTPGRVTHTSQAALLASQASAMYDDIHLGRRRAFAPDGKGYKDWHNFRWQRAKELGTANLLHTIQKIERDAKAAQATDLYGQQIKSAQEALREALLWNRRD